MLEYFLEWISFLFSSTVRGTAFYFLVTAIRFDASVPPKVFALCFVVGLMWEMANDN